MTLRLNGDSSGFTEIKAANAAGDNSIKLPASNGSANQLLQNGGTAGELQYTSAGGGLHYDSSGRLLVGISSATGAFSGISPVIQVEGTTYDSSTILAYQNANDSGSPGVLVLGKSRGTSSGSAVSVQNGDRVGVIEFNGADGTTRGVSLGSIASFVDGTPGTDVMPGKLTFYTNGGSSLATPRVEVGSNGALKLLTDCPGIDFSGISPGTGNGQAATVTVNNNLLDDYEEGYFDPNLAATAGSATFTPNGSLGYIKIGRMVSITGRMLISRTGSASGVLQFQLPFAADNSLTGTGHPWMSHGPCFTHAINYPADAEGPPFFWEVNTTTHAGWFYMRDGNSWTAADPNLVTGNSAYLTFTMTYRAAA